MTDICVIGGGPAGVFACFFAAKDNKRVTLIERNEDVLKKLLLTGNGKCNYSNSDLKSEYYNFGKDHPYSKLIEEFDSEKLEEFFMDRGMPTYGKNNCKYPRSERAETVKNVLTEMLTEKKIEILTGRKVVSAEYRPGKKTGENAQSKPLSEKDLPHFILKFEDGGKLECRKLIIATGGKAYPSTGSDGGGYRLARALGHTVTFTYPVLTRLFTEEKSVKEMAGVRFKAKVSAVVEGETVSFEEGELQFTENGLSGICIYNLSRYLSKPLEDGLNCNVVVDFMPEMAKESMDYYIEKLIQKNKDRRGLLANILGEKTAGLIYKRIVSEANGATGKELISHFTNGIKNFKIKISGHDSFSNAQVTKGGVSIDEVDENMASKICPGLFFAGEVLDVDGKCGGYNLHFAFASGRRAGLSAGE